MLIIAKLRAKNGNISKLAIVCYNICNNAKKANLGVFRLQNLGKIFKQISLDRMKRQFWT